MPDSASHELLTSYKEIFEKFTEDQLKCYIDLLSSKPKSRKPKIFNDPVWHSVSLRAIEIVLLDSPLLQRLRRIRQLGVAHWVYPGAGHTRFEHTVGVIHQVGQLVASIDNSPKCEGCIDEMHTKLLRLAALCHDIGHGVMSHVAENALENDDECQSLKLAFGDKLGIEEIAISEIAAYFIVGSPTFIQLLKHASRLADDPLPEDAAESIQKIIIGQSVSHEIPLLQEIITGPFDADKLDYMTRDAFMAGVPVVVDIPRLIQKVRAVRLLPSELPEKVAARVKKGLVNYVFIGIELSGGRTLDELMLARTLLFDKIYHHQKIRAAETMISSLLSHITNLLGVKHASVPYMFSDESLIDLQIDTLARMMNHEPNDKEKVTIEIASDLSSRLRERRLFVRCFAVASAMPADAYRSTTGQKLGLELALREMSKPDTRAQMEKEIVDEVEIILNELGRNNLLNQLPGNHLYSYIRISPPRPPSQGNDIPRAHLITGERKILPFNLDSAETRGWADGYVLTRDMGYVFAPPEFSVYVYLATEKLLRIKRGIHMPSTMLDYAKQDQTLVDDTRLVLSDKGYYANAPHDIWPMPERLNREDIEPRLARIASKFAGYQGIETETDSKPIDVFPAELIIDWLRQFRTIDMIESALEMIENIELISRHSIVQILDSFLHGHSDYQHSNLCTLGLPKDSSAIVTYFAGDLALRHGLTSSDLDNALASNKPIVFVDDFIGSGRQVVSILETWFGCAKTVDLHEDRGAPLSREAQKLMRKHKLAFVFIAGWKEGEELLKSKLKELKLSGLVWVGISEEKLPSVNTIKTFKNQKIQAEFLDICKNIGLELMRGPDYNAAKSDERSLGYGNRANLVIFPYNTPSQTLTCIWASGNYQGSPWSPLFPRRKKT